MSRHLTGVAVVTSADAAGTPFGMTCNSLTSVTLSPPTLLICVDLRSRTLAALRDRRAFAVNLLRDGSRSTAELFASSGMDRFDQVRWRGSPVTGLPWLVDDTHAMAECRISDLITVGDHAVVFGTVVNVEGGEGGPLLYGRRAYSDARAVPAS